MPRYLGLNFYRLSVNDLQSSVTPYDTHIVTPIDPQTITNSHKMSITSTGCEASSDRPFKSPHIPPHQWKAIPPETSVRFDPNINLSVFEPTIESDVRQSIGSVITPTIGTITDTTYDTTQSRVENQLIGYDCLQSTHSLSSGSVVKSTKRLTLPSTPSKLFTSGFGFISEENPNSCAKTTDGIQSAPIAAHMDPLISDRPAMETRYTSFVSDIVPTNKSIHMSKIMNLSDLSQLANPATVPQRRPFYVPNILKSDTNDKHKTSDNTPILDSKIMKALNEEILRENSKPNPMMSSTQSPAQPFVAKRDATLGSKDSRKCEANEWSDPKPSPFQFNWKPKLRINAINENQWPSSQAIINQSNGAKSVDNLEDIVANEGENMDINEEPIARCNAPKKAEIMVQNFKELYATIGSYADNTGPQTSHTTSHTRKDVDVCAPQPLNSWTHKYMRTPVDKPYHRRPVFSAQPSSANDMNFIRRMYFHSKNTSEPQETSKYFSKRNDWSKNEMLTNNLRTTPKPFTPKVLNQFQRKGIHSDLNEE